MSSGLYNTHKIDFDTTLDLTRLKPYGDTMNDGKVQTSFTLPIKDDGVDAHGVGVGAGGSAHHNDLPADVLAYIVVGVLREL